MSGSPKPALDGLGRVVGGRPYLVALALLLTGAAIAAVVPGASTVGVWGVLVGSGLIAFYVFRLATSTATPTPSEGASADRRSRGSWPGTSETKYRALFNSSSDSIMLMTEHGEFRDANWAAVSLFGASSVEELLRTHPGDISPEFQPDGSRSSEKARELIAIAEREGSHTFQWRHKRRDGSVFDSIVSLARMDVDGQILFHATCRDITEQKRAEEALRASERLYRLLVENVQAGITLIDSEYTILSVNAAQCRLFGKRPEDFIGKLCFHEFEKRDVPCPHCPGTRAMESGQPTSVETTGVRDDGSRFTVHIGACPVTTEDGNTTGFIELVEDITEQRRAQEALLASERQLRMFAENVSDVIWRMDCQGRFTYLSPSVEQLLGWKWKEGMQVTLADMMTPESLRGAHEGIQRILEAAQSGERLRLSQEYELHRQDGSTVWTEIGASGLFDESGQLIEILGVTRDIRERKRAEAALRASERQLRLLADNVNDIIWAVDFSGRLIYVSPSVRQLGYSAEGLLQHPMAELLTPEGAAVARTYLVQSVATAAAGQHIPGGTLEMELVCKDGSTIMAEISFSGMYDEAGRTVAFQGVTRDIRERKRAQAALALARDEAQTADRAKSRFLATMSHEIRTPMTAILGYADLLMDPTLDIRTRTDYAATIRRSGEHLLALINDILDLSKIEAGRMTLHLGPCRLVSVLAEVTSLLRPRAQQQGIAFSVEYRGAMPETIHTDGARLRQALINLAGNAVKFTPKGSVRLVASLLSDGGSGEPAMQIEVIDTGIGIAPEVLPELFRPFGQGDPDVAQRFGGTGLGLAISRHIAQMLGGDVTVRSELGRGSTFTLTLRTGSLHSVPMLQQPGEILQETSPKSWNPATDTLRGVRILLAEDGADNRRFLQAVLRRAGAEITTAENGRLAVEQCDTPAFDLILMDMNMPEMDGYEATSLLRNRGYRGPIVALTANAMSGDRQRCQAAGCDEYLTKPIDRLLLIQTIAALVHRAGTTTATATRAAEG